MKQCNKFQNMFYEYMDGTLCKADEVRLLEHLETCAPCKEEFAFVKAIHRELQEIPAAPLPENFAEKLHENLIKVRLEQPQKTKRNLFRLLPKYGAAISAAAAFTIMIMAYNGYFKPAEYPSGSDSSLSATAPPVPEAEYTPETTPQPTVQAMPESPEEDHSGTSEAKTGGGQSSSLTKAPAKQPSGSTEQKPNAVSPPKSSSSSSGSQDAAQENPSADWNFAAQPDKSNAGGSGGGPVTQYSFNSSTARASQNLIIVVHSTVDRQTLKQLYALPTFEVVGGNRYQMQRSYQNDLIKALKNLEYSIHFSSETSRIDKDAVIIELI